MLHLLGRFLFFLIRTIIHLPFAVLHLLQRAFFGVNFDKMNGYEFEAYIASYLRHKHYKDVTVTKASRDFGVDITAKKHRTTYAIQCKLYQGKVGNSAIQEAVAGKTYYGCDEAMVITNSYYYPGAIELARVNEVTLLDGDDLRHNPARVSICLRLLMLLSVAIATYIPLRLYYNNKAACIGACVSFVLLLTMMLLLSLHHHRKDDSSVENNSSMEGDASVEYNSSMDGDASMEDNSSMEGNVSTEDDCQTKTSSSSRLSPEELEAFMQSCNEDCLKDN